MRIRTIAAFMTAALALGTAYGQSNVQGYLPAGQIDLTKILPPEPQNKDIRYETDRAVFKAMKAGIGSERWDYAKKDIPSSAAAVMKDFSCAAGIALSPETQPVTYRLLARAGVDTARENNVAKDSFKRLRPFLIDKGEICEADPKDIGKSYDYPSGHATRGWTEGLILAELIPARATPILTRARSYGESRLVCRVHNASAVEAGRVGATATMDVVRAMPAYQADLVAARTELAGAQPKPDATACAREEKVVWPSVFVGLKSK